jgi:hypothetical protein
MRSRFHAEFVNGETVQPLIDKLAKTMRAELG